jgi:hypothetical protein
MEKKRGFTVGSTTNVDTPTPLFRVERNKGDWINTDGGRLAFP